MRFPNRNFLEKTFAKNQSKTLRVLESLGKREISENQKNISVQLNSNHYFKFKLLSNFCPKVLKKLQQFSTMYV